MKLMKLKPFAIAVAFVAGTTIWSTSFAQAPAGSTGECKDGTYTSATSKRGACAAHGGVKEWFGSSKKSEAKSKSESKEADKTEAKSAKTESKSTEKKSTGSTAAPAAAAAAPSTSNSTTTASKKSQENMRAEAAPGGGAGKVWVNTSSNVYHCSGDQWYGKTKEGEYMSEAQAKAKGARAARGKACS